MLITLLLTLLPGYTFATDVLTREFTSRYSLSSGVITFGEIARSLQRNNDGSYTFESNTVAVGALAWIVDGSVHEKSVWRRHQNSAQPLRYIFNKSKGEKNRNVELIFDWDEKSVTNIIDDKPWKLDIIPGVLDKHLYQLALMDDLSIGGKKQFHYKIADGGKLKDFNFELVREETVEVPFGKFHTLKLKRNEKKRRTIIWSAPELGYIPVRIHQYDKSGDKYVAELVELNGKTNHGK